MRVAIIGRSEIMFDTLELCLKNNFDVPIIITAKEAPEYKKIAADFEKKANEIGAIFYKTSKINDENIIRDLIQCNVDIALSINFSGIIPQNVIDTFKIGVLNAHGGDLPSYRGNACQAWAIINGEKEIGLTIYKMKGDYLDGGEIINKYFLPIDINTTVTDCWAWFETQIPQGFIDACNILSNDPNYYVEDSTLSDIVPLRCYPRMHEDGKINWNNSNEEIIRLINASCEPYSGAYCEFESDKLIIWKAKIEEDNENYLAVNGQVCEIGKESIVIITGKGKIRLVEIEYKGYRGNPSEIIKSIRKRLK